MTNTKVESGAFPYQDSSGYKYDISIEDSEQRDAYITLNGAKIDLEDWPKLRDKINSVCRAYKALTEN